MLKLSNINKKFKQGRKSLEILKNINLEIMQGELICLVGQSGSGKSTLLQVIAGLMKCDSGEIEFLDKKYSKLSDNKISEFRLKNIGFVYQYHHLLADFSALQNVMMPQRMFGVNYKQAKERAEELMIKVGLEERMDHLPYQLSGGQQQRVAIARALVNSPKLILADEPTGNLDSENARKIMDIFTELAEVNNSTLVIATHNVEISEKAKGVITIKDGVIIN